MQPIKSPVVPNTQEMKNHCYKMEEIDDYELSDQEYNNVELSSRNGDSLLISLVKNYPHLYAKTAKNQKNYSLAERSWQEIATISEQTASMCQKRWTRLRERYSKEKRIREQNMRNGIVTQHCWPHWAEMEFLSQHIVGRRSYKNKTPKIKRHRYERSYSNETFSLEERSSLSSSPAPIRANLSISSARSSPSTSTAVVPSSTDLRSPEAVDNVAFGSCDERVKEIIFDESTPETTSTVNNHSLNSNQNIETSEDIFCRYLASELKKMSEDEKKAATRRLMNALFEGNT